MQDIVDGHDAAGDRQVIADRAGAFFWTGALLVVLGVLSIVFSPISTLATGLLIGALLVLAGVAQIAHAFRCRRVRHIAWHGVLGALYAIGGASILAWPILGAASVTLVLAAFFIVEGGFRIALGVRWRASRGWGWLATGGAVSVALGLLLFVGLPAAAGVFLGILVGVNLVTVGFGLIMVARRAGREEETGWIEGDVHAGHAGSHGA